MSLSKSSNEVKHMVCDRVTKPLPLFTHATTHNGVVYVSCIQGFIPGTFDLPETVEEEARQVFHNLKLVLEDAGSSLERVIRITLYLVDMKDFPKVNEAENEAFPNQPPARSSIAVKELPHDARVVVEVIAALRE